PSSRRENQNRVQAEALEALSAAGLGVELAVGTLLPFTGEGGAEGDGRGRPQAPSPVSPPPPASLVPLPRDFVAGEDADCSLRGLGLCCLPYFTPIACRNP